MERGPSTSSVTIVEWRVHCLPFARPASVRVLRKPGSVLLRKLDGKPGRLAAAARSRECAPIG